MPREPRETRFAESLLRPWAMLFTEPILFSFSFYMEFIYGVLFLNFTAYPVVFKAARGWSTGTSGLSFLGISLGTALATALSSLVNRVHSYYVQKLSPCEKLACHISSSLSGCANWYTLVRLDSCPQHRGYYPFLPVYLSVPHWWCSSSGSTVISPIVMNNSVWARCEAAHRREHFQLKKHMPNQSRWRHQQCRGCLKGEHWWKQSRKNGWSR